MYCFTLNVGGDLSRGIRIEMDGRTPCPGVYIGGEKDGVALPVAEEWFHQMVELDRLALELPELKDCDSLKLPLIMNAGLEEKEIEEGASACKLVSRPGNEPDKRALVRVIPPDEVRIRHSGCYKMETFDGRRVTRGFPKLRDVPGIELLAEVGGEAIFIMGPGAAFRIGMPRGASPKFHMFRLTSTGAKPRLIDITPADRSEAA